MKFEELLQSAKNEGLEQGLQQGQERLLLLIQKMAENGEEDRIPRLYKDAELLQEMYEKYQV